MQEVTVSAVNFNEVNLISKSARRRHQKSPESLTSHFLATLYSCNECIFDTLDLVL